MEHLSKAERIPLVEEGEAVGDVARIYDDIMQFMQIPFVPNSHKAIGASPAASQIHWMFLRTFYEQTTLPQALTTMILYTIAAKSNCLYCSSNHEVSCRTMGIDEETLTALVEDLESVSPQRIGAIIEFALKVAKHSQTVTEEDYETLRQLGVDDGEIVEIVQVAAAGVYFDIMMDALKVDVEGETYSALADLRGT